MKRTEVQPAYKIVNLPECLWESILFMLHVCDFAVVDRLNQGLRLGPERWNKKMIQLRKHYFMTQERGYLSYELHPGSWDKVLEGLDSSPSGVIWDCALQAGFPLLYAGVRAGADINRLHLGGGDINHTESLFPKMLRRAARRFQNWNIASFLSSTKKRELAEEECRSLSYLLVKGANIHSPSKGSTNYAYFKTNGLLRYVRWFTRDLQDALAEDFDPLSWRNKFYPLSPDCDGNGMCGCIECIPPPSPPRTGGESSSSDSDDESGSSSSDDDA